MDPRGVATEAIRERQRQALARQDDALRECVTKTTLFIDKADVLADAVLAALEAEGWSVVKCPCPLTRVYPEGPRIELEDTEPMSDARERLDRAIYADLHRQWNGHPDELLGYDPRPALDALLAMPDDLIACLVESGALERGEHLADHFIRRRPEGGGAR